MNYCEICKGVFEETRCPSCDRKLREAQADDFCFLAKMDEHKANIFQDVLAEKEVPCVLAPYRRSVWGRNYALPITDNLVYVPYAHFNTAYAILQEDAKEQQTLLLRSLQENFDKLHLENPRAEKKMRKKLRIPPDQDFLSAIKERISNCDKIVDAGTAGGRHYLRIYHGEDRILVNFTNYEIL